MIAHTSIIPLFPPPSAITPREFAPLLFPERRVRQASSLFFPPWQHKRWSAIRSSFVWPFILSPPLLREQMALTSSPPSLPFFPPSGLPVNPSLFFFSFPQAIDRLEPDPPPPPPKPDRRAVSLPFLPLLFLWRYVKKRQFPSFFAHPFPTSNSINDSARDASFFPSLFLFPV